MKGFQALAISLVAAALLQGCALADTRTLDAVPGNLEGRWLFHTDPTDTGERDGWQRREFDDSTWRELKAPGYWEAQGVTDPRPGEAPRPKDGVPYTDYDGVAWYRLHFIAPETWAGQPLELDLGTIDDEDHTYLNGVLVGQVPDEKAGVPGPGVTPVSVWRRYRVPPGVLRPGEENVLAIRVTDGGGPGGLTGTMMTLLPEKEMQAVSRLPGDDRSLAERWASPPASNRILKIIHSWPDDANAQDALIRTLVAQGFGGVVCNVSFADYLESEARWQAFVRAVGAAREAGMALWLYDERGYPSGIAGGLTLDGRLLPAFRPTENDPQVPPPDLHPEWEARGLLVAEAMTAGGDVNLELPPGTLVQAVACPVRDGLIAPREAVDLSAQVSAGRLTWQAPAGRWHVMVMTESRLYEGTHAAVSLADKLPYINLLMPEPTQRFLEVTHERYASHLGADLGRLFEATFTDEPSLMSYFMRPMPYRPLPWAPGFADAFRARRGYALEPLLPALVAEAGPEGSKVRYDYWQTVAELVSDSFFGQIQDWCHAHNLRSGGHLLAEEGLVGHVPFYGDFYRCVRRLDAPSIDCLTSSPPDVPWYVARLVSSVAELEGKPLTMCETSDFAQIYRPEGDQRPVREVTEAEIRGTCNRLLLNGINAITSYYSFGGLGTAELQRLNQWVGRCSTMLRGGHQVTDIAVLYPIESIWPRYRPARQGATESPAAMQVESSYRAALDGLWTDGRDFTIIDSRALSEATVRDGSLVHGQLRWRVLILPCTDTLPLDAWEKVAAFWRAGGVLIALTALPANSEREFPSATVQGLSAEIFGPGEGPRVRSNEAGGAGVYLPPGTEVLLPPALGRLLARDVTVADGTSCIHATHRRIGGHDVYFVINDSAVAYTGAITVPATSDGQVYDPGRGSVVPVPAGAPVKLDLEPYGGVILRFAETRPSDRLPAGDGALPGLNLQPVPAAEPTVGRGEFVRDELTPIADPAGRERRVWKASGTLTRSNVDTFLFVSFAYPQGLDLSGADLLAFDTWVPPGQNTNTQLLVLLHDRDGAIYLAQTERPLNQAGHHQALIPLSRFALAGWSQDPDGKLDWQHVANVSIGWGGYYGTEGERVEFSLAAPQMGALGP